PQPPRSRRPDDVFGGLHATLRIGLSYGWWISKHNRHHAHPNQIGRDPDIAGRAIAFTAGQSRGRHGAGAWLARSQSWLFFPMLLLEGLNLHAAGVRALLGQRHTKVKVAEADLLAANMGGYLAAVFLVLPPGQAAALLAGQERLFGISMGDSFAPNHKGMPVLREDEKLDFLRRQVLTLTEHPRRPAHRPRPRRAQLPDRTSPVPVDAAAEPPARTGTSAGVLRLSQHSLLRDGPAGLLCAGIATPPPRRQAASPTRILVGPRLTPMCSLTADHEAVAS